METETRDQLNELRTNIVAAIAEAVRTHVCSLRSRGVEFYGYAVLPGEPEDIRSLVAVTNAESDLQVPPDHPEYRYRRFSVDEWATWDHDALASVSPLLAEANNRFAALHGPHEESTELDEFERGHADTLLEAVVSGLALAKNQNVFGETAPFLVVWISDSDHPIVSESVRQLNSSSIVEQFLAEFG